MTSPTVTTPTEARPGRAAPWIAIVVAVVLGAVLQAATAVPGLGTASSPWFTVQVVVSVLVLVAEISVVAWACRALVRREGQGRLSTRLVLWSAVVVLVSLVVAVVVLPAVVLVLIAALCVLPAATSGERNALRGFRVFRRTPVRAILASVAVVVVTVLTWVVALVAGFFLTGALGGAAMWLWFGLVGALLLLWWTRLHDRAAAPAGR